ncbi:MAG TPA: hypothetical protein VGJ07_20495, partial [Rugosimonospora sp.]
MALVAAPGVVVIDELCTRLRGPQARPGASGAFMAGLRPVSWDATTLDVPDSPANTPAFMASHNKRGRGAFPKVRLLTLIECGTHAVIDAAFGAVSEQALARRVLGSLARECCCWATRTSRPTDYGNKPPLPGRTCYGAGGVPAMGVLATADLFRQHPPELKVRVGASFDRCRHASLLSVIRGRTFHLDLSSIGAEPLEAKDPRQIGAFPIRAVLGSGGMGRVYLGVAPDGYTAVKRVLPYLSNDRTFLRHFGHELDN